MVLRNVIETNEEKPPFQLFFLKNDEDQSIEVEEIDFTEHMGRPITSAPRVAKKPLKRTPQVHENVSEELTHES